MKYYNNFNDMFTSNTDKNYSVFNAWSDERETSDEWEHKWYYFEGYDDGTARASVEYISDIDRGDYWTPPCVDTEEITFDIDFTTDEGYEWLEGMDYLTPRNETNNVTGNTTNEPITKENWKTFAETLFDWNSVWEEIEDYMDIDTWYDILEKVKHTSPDFPKTPAEIEEEEFQRRWDESKYSDEDW